MGQRTSLDPICFPRLPLRPCTGSLVVLMRKLVAAGNTPKFLPCNKTLDRRACDANHSLQIKHSTCSATISSVANRVALYRWLPALLGSTRTSLLLLLLLPPAAAGVHPGTLPVPQQQASGASVRSSRINPPQRRKLIDDWSRLQIPGTLLWATRCELRVVCQPLHTFGTFWEKTQAH